MRANCLRDHFEMFLSVPLRNVCLKSPAVADKAKKCWFDSVLVRYVFVNGAVSDALPQKREFKCQNSFYGSV